MTSSPAPIYCAKDEADGNFCIVCTVTVTTGGRAKTSSHQLFNGIYGWRIGAGSGIA
ncbi:hypothetical protein M513_14127, partial [Trichuris suis]